MQENNSHVLIDGAIQAINELGWTQGEMIGEKGYCLDGALRFAATGYAGGDVLQGNSMYEAYYAIAWSVHKVASEALEREITDPHEGEVYADILPSIYDNPLQYVNDVLLKNKQEAIAFLEGCKNIK